MNLGEEQPQPYRHPNHRVHISNSEPGRSFRNEDQTERYQVVKTRDGLLKKIDLPAFDGGDTYAWLALAEIFFRIGGYDDRAKMEVVSVSLAGDVLSWFNSETHRRNLRSWNEFKEKLGARFSKVKYRDPSQPFFEVSQTETVAQYIHLFEDLSMQVT